MIQMRLRGFLKRQRRIINTNIEFNFANKSALLDTNILRAFLDDTKGSARFGPVFDFLRENQCHPYILGNITSFEFVGFCSNKKTYDTLKNWLENTFDQSPLYPDDYKLATKLSVMYKCKNPSINPKQISFVDCLYAAQLKRVNGAFIVTTDINDYPAFVFDMPKHFAIDDLSGNTTFVGLKTFNATKFSTLEKNFNKSG